MSRAVRIKDHNNLFEKYLRQQVKKGESDLGSSNMEGKFFFLLRGPPPSPTFTTNKMQMDASSPVRVELQDPHRNADKCVQAYMSVAQCLFAQEAVCPSPYVGD